MKYRDLQKIAKEVGIKANLARPQLVQKILEAKAKANKPSTATGSSAASLPCSATLVDENGKPDWDSTDSSEEASTPAPAASPSVTGEPEDKVEIPLVRLLRQIP